MTRIWVCLQAAAAALIAGPALAREPATLEACIASADEGEAFRDQGAYSRARSAFAACSSERCPVAIQRECVRWHREIEERMPSIVVVVRDSEGSDLVDAALRIDDSPVPNPAGRPLDIDPGPHTLTVTHRGRSSKMRIVVNAGEKLRAVQFRLPSALEDGGRNVHETSPSSTSFTLPLVLTGTSLIALSAFAVLGLTARSDLDRLEGSPCAATRTCPVDDVQSIRTRFTLADVALGVSVVTAGAAVWFWVHPPKSASRATARRVVDSRP